MNRHLPRLFVILSFGLLIAIGLSITYIASRSSSPSVAQPIGRVDDQVKEIAGYRSWSKVNNEPQVMPRITATLCAPVSDTRADDPNNPHRNKFVTVYVNDIGRQAMLEQVKPRFPIGSVIVKEKLPDKASQAP